MKKLFLLLTALFITWGLAGGVSATIINPTFSEGSNFQFESIGDPTLNTPIVVGDFTFTMPTAEHIVSASIEGLWGNSSNPSTMYTTLGLAGVNLGFAFSSQSEYSNTSLPQLQWDYAFTASELTTLEALSGVAFSLLATPTGPGAQSPEWIRLTIPELGFVIETAPNSTIPPSTIPEPATAMLLGIGLLGLAGVSRKKDSK